MSSKIYHRNSCYTSLHQHMVSLSNKDSKPLSLTLYLSKNGRACYTTFPLLKRRHYNLILHWKLQNGTPYHLTHLFLYSTVVTAIVACYTLIYIYIYNVVQINYICPQSIATGWWLWGFPFKTSSLKVITEPEHLSLLRWVAHDHLVFKLYCLSKWYL